MGKKPGKKEEKQTRPGNANTLLRSVNCLTQGLSKLVPSFGWFAKAAFTAYSSCSS